MKWIFRLTAVLVFATSFSQMSRAENIAFLVPGSLFISGEDPINIPDDKDFLLETMELEEPGMHWLVLHLENDLGHTVNIYNSDEDDPGQVEEMNDLIFVSEALGSGSVAGDYAVTNRPFLTSEFFLMDDMGVTSGAAFTGGASNDGMEIMITDTEHPITQGLPETFSVTVDDPETGEPTVATLGVVTDPSLLLFGDVLAVLPTSIDQSAEGVELPENVPTLIVADAGSDLGNETRWAFLGYSDVPPLEDFGGVPDNRTSAILTEPAIQMFDQTIAWLLGEEPSKVEDWAIQ